MVMILVIFFMVSLPEGKWQKVASGDVPCQEPVDVLGDAFEPAWATLKALWPCTDVYIYIYNLYV